MPLFYWVSIWGFPIILVLLGLSTLIIAYAGFVDSTLITRFMALLIASVFFCLLLMISIRVHYNEIAQYKHDCDYSVGNVSRAPTCPDHEVNFK